MQTSRAGKSTSRKGFTLFEILIVMVILALSAGVTIPLLGSFDSDGDLNKASTVVLEAVSVARSRALMSGENTKLRFTPSKIYVENSGDLKNEHNLPDGVKVRSVKTASGKKNVILFSKDGVCEEVIVGLSSGEYLLSIRVFSVSGFQTADGELSFQDK